MFSFKCRIMSPNTAFPLLILHHQQDSSHMEITHSSLKVRHALLSPDFCPDIPQTQSTPTHLSKPNSSIIFLAPLPLSSGLRKATVSLMFCVRTRTRHRQGLHVSPCPALGLARSRHRSMTVY